MDPKVLLAGSIGALLVFVLTTLKDWLWGWWLRKRECEGLLRLASIEIEVHRTDLGPHIERNLEGKQRDYVEDPELVRTPGRVLRTSTWEQVRTRISQLLPAGKFSDLALYYASVEWINDLLDESTSPHTREDSLASGAELVDKDAEKVRKWIREEYIGRMGIDPHDPEVSENNY